MVCSITQCFLVMPFTFSFIFSFSKDVGSLLVLVLVNKKFFNEDIYFSFCFGFG